MGLKDGNVLQLSKVCTIDGFTMYLIWASIAYVLSISNTMHINCVCRQMDWMKSGTRMQNQRKIDQMNEYLDSCVFCIKLKSSL